MGIDWVGRWNLRNLGQIKSRPEHGVKKCCHSYGLF